jgi:hypothetical protein
MLKVCACSQTKKMSSSFQFKYNSSRAEDILNGKDPVVFAGATALRGISLPLISNSENNNKKQEAYLSIRSEKTIESQSHLHKLFQDKDEQKRISDLKSQFSSDSVSSSSSTSAVVDPLVMEALSRGFAIRRQRNENPTKNQTVKIPQNHQSHHVLLLTANEISRLQTGIAANYHQAQSRTESKSLFDKFAERLALQRVNFVNNLIESEKKKKEKKKETKEKEKEMEKK